MHDCLKVLLAFFVADISLLVRTKATGLGFSKFLFNILLHNIY